MPAPEIIHQLVRRFADNLPAYRSGHYIETQLHREFLDPFFKAFGWDVLQRQIDAADTEIDRLVYDLYELTQDEIKIVEEGK